MKKKCCSFFCYSLQFFQAYLTFARMMFQFYYYVDLLLLCNSLLTFTVNPMPKYKLSATNFVCTSFFQSFKDS